MCDYLLPLSFNLTHNHNQRELHIDSPETDVPDDFLTSISANGELVHVVMIIRSFTVKGITSLVRNSPKLITLYLQGHVVWSILMPH